MESRNPVISIRLCIEILIVRCNTKEGNLEKLSAKNLWFAERLINNVKAASNEFAVCRKADK